MLNTISDMCKVDSMSEIFLTSNENVEIDKRNATVVESNLTYQETINIIDRRKTSFVSSKSQSSNSGEVCQGETFDHPGQQSILDGDRLDNGSLSTSHCLRLVTEFIAELLGTAILVLFGCSGIAQYILSYGKLSSFLSVNFAFGFGVMIAVYIAGPVSGAHLNPAISIAMLSLRSITPLQCFIYCFSQFLGAFIGAALVFGTYYDAINHFDGGIRQVIGNQSTAGIFGTLPAQEVSQVSLFFDQVLSTSLLLIAICALSDKRNKLVTNAQFPLAVGFIIVAIGVAFGYNCGYPINPARDLSPRLFTLCVGYGKEVFSVGNYYFWIPCIGPLFGGLIGAWIYHGYSKLMKIHIETDETEIVRARYTFDV